MIKAIIFDLDGVLVSTKRIHFDAFNVALGEIDSDYCLSFEEHLNHYDGLSTRAKLETLSRNRGLPTHLYRDVWNRKQELTMERYAKIEPNLTLIATMRKLKEQYKIAIATNSIPRTTDYILERLRIDDYIDVVLTNGDVSQPKPSAEIYLRAMVELRCDPKECVVFEDSPKGLIAATASGANVCVVKDPSEVTYDNVIVQIQKLNHEDHPTPWIDDTLTVLIPMAGQGSRFVQAGYSFPKPLIDIGGKTMIQRVVESLNIRARYVYLVRREHNETYNLRALLNLITPGCTIIEVGSLTEGSACTTLLAKNLINTDRPLLIANSDQIVEWSSSEFLYKMGNRGVDGGILTFPNSHIKWSYAEVDEDNLVRRVAEKIPISSHATAGVYWYKCGSDYVRAAEAMIAKDVRVNGEFYICPVFNELLADGKQILIHEIPADHMHGTGTPEDLQVYLTHIHDRA